MAFLLRRVLLLSLAIYLGAWGLRIYARKYYLWLPAYVRWSLQKHEQSGKPTHVFFLYADHFEPGEHVERARYWEREYPRLADRHRDSAGRPVQHTWFYPGDGLNRENLSILQGLVAAGYGEVEFHLHHENDTEQTARLKYHRAIEYFQKFGFLKTPDGRTRFAFAHGMNGLEVMGHGAASDAEIQESLGPHFDRALSYLEKRYNDGVHYVLHYVTAREAYNLVRAAAAHLHGDPRQYLDWIIPPYVADQRPQNLPHLVSVVP